MSTLSLNRVQVQVLERSKDNFEDFHSFTQRMVYQCHLPNFVTFIRREIIVSELRI